MSLKPELVPPIPEETKRVAKVAFPKGNTYMRMRDELGTFYQVSKNRLGLSIRYLLIRCSDMPASISMGTAWVIA